MILLSTELARRYPHIVAETITPCTTGGIRCNIDFQPCPSCSGSLTSIMEADNNIIVTEITGSKAESCQECLKQRLAHMVEPVVDAQLL